MKIRLWSDIHLEFGDMKFTPREDDAETVLVIAGDFQVGSRSEQFLREICQHFRAVLYTCGNHEYYGHVLQHVDRDLQQLADEIPNFHFLNPGHIDIDDVRFIGATLWTDFDNADPSVMLAAKFSMNDYRKIRYVYSGYYGSLAPEAVFVINQKHRQYINDALDSKGDVRKTVVFTHHPPIRECTRNKFYQSEDLLTFCYCNTNIEHIVEKADYWLHGHIHNWSNVEYGNCKIIAKPRGYIGHQTCAYEYDLMNRDAEIIEV